MSLGWKLGVRRGNENVRIIGWRYNQELINDDQQSGKRTSSDRSNTLKQWRRSVPEFIKYSTSPQELIALNSHPTSTDLNPHRGIDVNETPTQPRLSVIIPQIVSLEKERVNHYPTNDSTTATTILDRNLHET